MSAVYFFSMANFKGKDDKLIVFYLGDDPVFADPVVPIPRMICRKRFAEQPGILAAVEVLC